MVYGAILLDLGVGTFIGRRGSFVMLN